MVQINSLFSLCVGMASGLPAVCLPSPTRARRLRYGDVSSQTWSFQRVSAEGHQDCSGFWPVERKGGEEERE